AAFFSSSCSSDSPRSMHSSFQPSFACFTVVARLLRGRRSGAGPFQPLTSDLQPPRHDVPLASLLVLTLLSRLQVWRIAGEFCRVLPVQDALPTRPEQKDHRRDHARPDRPEQVLAAERLSLRQRVAIEAVLRPLLDLALGHILLIDAALAGDLLLEVGEVVVRRAGGDQARGVERRTGAQCEGIDHGSDGDGDDNASHRGNPSPRCAITLRCTSDVPPAIVEPTLIP